jgi:hypothetical protein
LAQLDQPDNPSQAQPAPPARRLQGPQEAAEQLAALVRKGNL